jgi:glycosyltransferase involved in cell wall biosynthesis
VTSQARAETAKRMSGSISNGTRRGFPGSRPCHVLVICYDFPGIGTHGVIRTYQLAKNLPSFGWRPVILTAHSCSGGQEDDIETSDGHLNCSKFTVVPSRVLVPFRTDLRTVRQPFDGMVPKNTGLLKRMLRYASQLAVPDGKIGWLPAAVRRALQVAREYPIRMCFSVSLRPTSHLVARRVARSLGIPWVADFAFPWSDAYWLSGRPRFIEWFDQQLEASALRAAQHITVAYADIARGMSARYGTAWQKKISVIPTGFSEDLFAEKSVPTASKFRAIYPGNHFCEKGRDGDCFLKAIDAWIGSDPRLGDKVEFLFMGKRDDELLRQRAAMVHPEVIRIEPFMSHRACIQTVLSSHLCVVNTVGNRIPDKVYECMRAGKWILALTNAGSDLENLIRHYSRGISVPARDLSAIRNALQKVWQGVDLKKSERIEADSSVDMYSAKHSAAMVSRIFDGLLVL